MDYDKVIAMLEEEKRKQIAEDNSKAPNESKESKFKNCHIVIDGITI